jgi:CBS domain-containing protein
MKVREIMTSNPATCTPETPLQQVARTMEQRDCGAVPIITHAGTGVVGIVTDRDIAIRSWAKGRNPLELTAESCMTSPAATITDDADVDECVKLMETKKIRRVPVVDAAGHLVGIVAQADVARHESRKETGELVRDLSEP